VYLIRAKRITGQIIKVDGGRALTLSGYVHWEGHQMMDRRFEPTSKNLLTYIGKKIGETIFNPTRYPQGSVEWCQEKQTSNWSTHLEEAHIK